jgi:hypothetical protein
LLLNDTLKGIYGDKFIAISVHAGFFAFPCPHSGAPCPGSAAPPGAFAADYTNPTSLAWDTKFGNSAQGNPNGMIDRMGYPTDNVKIPDDWSTLINNQSQEPCNFRIRIKNVYDPATRELKTAVQCKALATTSDSLKLQIVLIEDSIVDWQEWYLPHLPQFDSTYLHRHILRGALNGSFGEPFSTGTLTSGTLKLTGYTYSINANFNAAHCKVVAFIYDESNYRVYQAEEAEVIE